ncbi:MAG: PH domain-containing protein [Lachnotalea sp.]
MAIEYTDNMTSEEYNEIRKEVNWEALTKGQAQRVLQTSCRRLNMSYQKLDTKALVYMYITTIIWSVIVLIIAGGAYYKFGEIIYVHWGCILSTIVILLDMIITPGIRYKRYRYAINEEQIDTIEGFLFIQRQIVPIERVHKISINQGPIEHIFHLSRVNVVTAGGDVSIKYLKEETAQMLAETLKNKVNTIVVNEREETNV